jgi:hypothetical protein
MYTLCKAISALKERGGSSRQAILKYIVANFNVGKDAKPVNARLKLALRAGVKNKNLKQAKGTGNFYDNFPYDSVKTSFKLHVKIFIRHSLIRRAYKYTVASFQSK